MIKCKVQIKVSLCDLNALQPCTLWSGQDKLCIVNIYANSCTNCRNSNNNFFPNGSTSFLSMTPQLVLNPQVCFF